MTDQPIRVGDELFLGRLDEQDRFREVLHTVLTRRDDDDASPFIFLIYGEGGMGKSQLTRRLHDIATTEPPFERDVQALRLDWELIRNNTPALRVARHQIHPETVLDALHRAALDRDWGHHFKPYQHVIDRRKQAEQDVAKALDREREHTQYTALRDLGATGLAKLVRMSLPLIGQTGEEFSRTLLSAGIQLGAEQAATAREQAEQFLKARLKPDLYDIYRRPHQQLARALGQGLRHIAHDRPLVLSLDTYEIIAEAADTSIRQVIKAAGPRVVWLIAGRDNLAASRPGDRYVGYSAEFTRNLIVWDIQELAIEYVTTYLLDRAPDRPPTSNEAAAIHRVTLGVPLALRQVADLWAQGIELTAITEGIPDYAPREELIRLMCERVLIHVEKDATGQADRRTLYTLAMQPRPDPEVQATILRPDDSPFDLNARLADLARHYSVVRLSGGARLHEAMGSFVNEYLMRIEAPAGNRTQDIATQAVQTLHRRRARIETNYPTLEERLDSEDWQQTTLDLLHWLFWQDEPTALHELIPRLVEGLGYDLAFSQSLLDVASTFTPLLSRDGQRMLKRLNLTPENLEVCLTELDKLAQRRWLEAGYAGQIAERQAILLLWQGRWLADKEQYTDALQTFLTTERRLPGEAVNLREQLAEAFSDLGWALGWEQRGIAIPSSEAELALNKAVALDKTDGSYWVGLGVIKHGLGKNTEAVEALRKGIELEGERAYSLNWLGNVYSDLDRHEEAIQAYQQAIDLDPNYAFSHNGLGNIYNDLSRHEEAIQAYQQAIDFDPKFASPHNGLGNVYRNLGRHEEAIQAYQQAIDLDPETAGYHSNLGNVYNDLGRHEEAIQSYRQAIHLDPKFASPYNGLGNVYRNLGQHEEAIQSYQQAIDLNPDYAWAYNGLGIIYESQQDYDQALVHYQQAIDHHTSNQDRAISYRNLGDVCVKSDRYEEAIQAYQQAIDLDPDHAGAYNGLGLVYENQQNYEQALVHYQQAIDRHTSDQDRAVSYRNLGDVYRKLDHHEEAVQAYQQAIDLDPKLAAPHNGLGNVYRALGRHEAAIQAYQQAIDLDPDNAGAYNGLSIVYRDLGRYKEVIQAYQQAIDLDHEDADFRVGLAAALYKTGQKKEAEEQLRQARKLMPPADEAPYSWACLEAVSGHTEAALDYLAKALAQKPTQRTWAKRDPDLESLRGHPRFEQLVGGGEGE